MINRLKFTMAFLFLAAFITQKSVAAEYIPGYKITKRSVVKAIPDGKSVFKFTFFQPDGKKVKKNLSITIAVNGKMYYSVADSNGVGTLSLNKGKHGMHISTYAYEEIELDTIISLSQERIEISINFELDHAPRPMKKPVIYVYAPIPTKVNIQLDVVGNLDFTYPVYNKGWDLTANVDGTIEIGDKKYNYLFWEGSDVMFLGFQKNISQGYSVKKDSLLGFLESSLSQMGFNSKEAQDFITFWYPQMERNELNFVHFIFNETCDKFARLNVIPKPQSVFRVSMLWKAMSPDSGIEFLKQEFPIIKRDGLTVIEWGGVEVEN